MKILINAYACSPYQGSEPGMGWNFVKCLFGRHELHVITECKYESEIEEYFAAHPEESHFVTFYYIKRVRHNLLRKIWPPSYYWTYAKWQKDVLKYAMILDNKEHFDIVHQLNMIGYREPGFLWKMNKPFVWGPIGGFNITPWKLLYTMGCYGFIFYSFRNIINIIQMNTSLRVRNAIMKADVLMCATQDDADTIKKLWNKVSVLMPEVGLTQNDFAAIAKGKDNHVLKLCWSGLHIPRKSLNLLLEALQEIGHVELHVLGEGPKTLSWKKKARKLGLGNVFWHGKVDRKIALSVMQECDVFVQTSLSDATSTVLLEALSLGLPVIALNHLGFSNVINETCGMKIDVNNKKQIVRDFNKAIRELDRNRTLLSQLSSGAKKRAEEYSWSVKADIITSLYESAYKKYNNIQ